jgi:hypothetical protein
MLEKLRAWLLGSVLWPEISLVRLQPGDVIVYRTDEVLDERQREAAIVYLQREFPGHRVLVVDAGGELQILRPEGADA